MILAGHAKATRHKHLQTLLNLSRFLNKDWIDATADDVGNTVMIIHDRYADDRGKETNTTYDHKKVLKISFRWLKLDSRSFTEVGDPPQTKHIKMKKVADKISREELITEDDLTRLLHVCGENTRDRSFIDCQHEAGTRPEFDAITNHPKVIYLYPNALYAEIKTDYSDNSITLVRGHNYPESKIVNGFDWKYDNSILEYDTNCKDMGFDKIENGWMLNCYPENPVHQSKVLLKMIKEF